MKLKLFLLATALLSASAIAQESQQVNNYQVPFYNVSIQPNTQLQASYNFDPNHQTVVCTNNTLYFLSLAWQYKGKQSEALLPPGGHLALKGQTYPEGYFADVKGLLMITNGKPVGDITTVSCEYHTWA